MHFDGFTLAAATADLGTEPAARAHADVVEFRMDLADEPRGQLSAYDGELPILATNRASWEGGAYEGSDADRLAELATASEHDAVVAIDVELRSIRDGEAQAVLETARANDVSVVASAHDFEGTPSRAAMTETLVAGASVGDVGKLAVTATSLADTLALLEVTRTVTEDGHRIATMAMGAVGQHTRAVAPVYGSKIGYAPVDPDDATAPGQYDLETLSALVASLDVGRD